MTDDSTNRTSGRLQKEIRQTKPFTSLHAETFLNLVRTAEQLQHALRLNLKSYGITETQYNTLRILRGAGNAGLTCAEIAERLISRDPDITRLVGRLERGGLVRRARDPKDRRIVVTRISQQGLDRLTDLDEVVTKSVTASLAHLTNEEMRKMIRLLERTRDSGT